MLTKQDLNQIKKVVDGSIKSVKIDVSGLKKDVSGLKEGMSTLKRNVSKLQKDMTDVKKDVKKIDKKVDYVIDFFDREHIDLEKRTQRIETHLHLPALADF